MRQRNKSFLFLLLLIIFLCLLLFIPLLFFPGLVTAKGMNVSGQLQAQPAVVEQPVVHPAVQPKVVQEDLSAYRQFKRRKVYEQIAQNLVSQGLTKEDLKTLTDSQKALLNQIVDEYSKLEPTDFSGLLALERVVKPLEDQFKKELHLPRVPLSSSVSAPVQASSEESNMKKTMDFAGALIDVLHSGLTKASSLGILGGVVGAPGLAF